MFSLQPHKIGCTFTCGLLVVFLMTKSIIKTQLISYKPTEFCSFCGKMSRQLKQHEKEHMKMAMLKQEETFKQQVRSMEAKLFPGSRNSDLK